MTRVNIPRKSMESSGRVLLISIQRANYPITVDIIHQIISPITNELLRIVIFERSNQVQVLVELRSKESAQRVMDTLQGREIYDSCCHLNIVVSHLESISVRENNEKSFDFTVAFGLPTHVSSAVPYNSVSPYSHGSLSSGFQFPYSSPSQLAVSAERLPAMTQLGGFRTLPVPLPISTVSTSVATLPFQSSLEPASAMSSLYAPVQASSHSLPTTTALPIQNSVSPLTALSLPVPVSVPSLRAPSQGLSLSDNISATLSNPHSLYSSYNPSSLNSQATVPHAPSVRLGSVSSPPLHTVPLDIVAPTGGGLVKGTHVLNAPPTSATLPLPVSVPLHSPMSVPVAVSASSPSYSLASTLSLASAVISPDISTIQHPLTSPQTFHSRNSSENSPVLMVYHLPRHRPITTDNIFNLLSLYGRVLRVKLLHKPERAAMVEFASYYQAKDAQVALTRAPCFSDFLHLVESRHTHVKDGLPAAEAAVAHSLGVSTTFGDFTDSPLQRVKGPGHAVPHYKPSAVLYFANCPPDVTSSQLISAIAALTTPPREIEFLEGIDARFGGMRSGFMSFASVSDAVEAIMMANNVVVSASHIRLSFSVKSSAHSVSSSQMSVATPHPASENSSGFRSLSEKNSVSDAASIITSSTESYDSIGLRDKALSIPNSRGFSTEAGFSEPRRPTKLNVLSTISDSPVPL